MLLVWDLEDLDSNNTLIIHIGQVTLVKSLHQPGQLPEGLKHREILESLLITVTIKLGRAYKASRHYNINRFLGYSYVLASYVCLNPLLYSLLIYTFFSF